MEEITEGVNNINIAETQKKNRIQVSNTKKPLFFYVNLAKRYMLQHNEVELSGLGMAISTVVSVAEILKNNGFAVEKSELFFKIPYSLLLFCNQHRLLLKQNATLIHHLYITKIELNASTFKHVEIMTSTVEIKDDSRGRPVQKAKIEVVLGKTANFDELMAVAQEARENGNGEE
ncbi:hypothetical protein SASPL_157471 [Salvia splendens]|uniref:DNA/RNA-binding protein Alba-like domain-containing protein n=1 Tax=Salvia splendens TaxID=180675 RepID=A0A8X8YUY7_SALSN|nr:hypothetical protein SASPL_157471 [Salvia splendens]